MHVAVLGPGGVGGLVAAALDRAGTPTTVVAREQTVALLDRDGLSVDSVRLGEFVARPRAVPQLTMRSEEHTSELQSRQYLVCRLLLDKNKLIIPAHVILSR